MSSADEYRKYQEALRSGDKAAAAAAFQRYLDAKKQEGGHNSKPTLVNLSSKAITYPNAVPLENIPSELERDPEFFNLMQRVSGKG
jgi:hypothetical protein